MRFCEIVRCCRLLFLSKTQRQIHESMWSNSARVVELLNWAVFGTRRPLPSRSFVLVGWRNCTREHNNKSRQTGKLVYFDCYTLKYSWLASVFYLQNIYEYLPHQGRAKTKNRNTRRLLSNSQNSAWVGRIFDTCLVILHCSSRRSPFICMQFPGLIHFFHMNCDSMRDVLCLVFAKAM